MSLQECVEHQGMIQNIEVFVATCHSKKACHIHRSLEATASKISVALWFRPLWLLCHPTGQFFHSQCVQFNEPNIPGNPQDSPSSRRRAMSSVVGDLKYWASNNSIMV